MEKVQALGLTRAIGVSNCTCVMLFELMTFCQIPPAINQIEIHPYFTQEPIKAVLKKVDVAVSAYAPMMP